MIISENGEHLKRISNLKILKSFTACEVNGCPVPTPVFPITCWLQGKGRGSEHLTGQRCDWRHHEQGEGVGGAATWGPMPLQRHKIPGKPFLQQAQEGALIAVRFCKASGSSSHPPPPLKSLVRRWHGGQEPRPRSIAPWRQSQCCYSYTE